MKFSLELLPNEPVKNIVDIVKLAEDIGFDNVWITDHYNNRDVFEVLACVASNTSTIKMGSGVSNPYVRNPVTIAAATATLDEISEGRAVVGVGPGDKATMETLNLTWNKPVRTVKNAINTIRTLVDGNVLGDKASLNGIERVQDYIPIYMAAQGPRMLETSGEVADGTLINASNEKDFEIAIPLINKGIEKSAKPERDFNYAAYTACSIESDINKAYDNARIVVSFIIAGAPPVVLERHNIPLSVAQEINNALANQNFKKAASLVTDDMCNAFAVCGNQDNIMDKILTFEDIGINEFVVGSPIGRNREESLKLIGDVLNSY